MILPKQTDKYTKNTQKVGTDQSPICWPQLNPVIVRHDSNSNLFADVQPKRALILRLNAGTASCAQKNMLTTYLPGSSEQPSCRCIHFSARSSCRCSAAHAHRLWPKSYTKTAIQIWRRLKPISAISKMVFNGGLATGYGICAMLHVEIQ